MLRNLLRHFVILIFLGGFALVPLVPAKAALKHWCAWGACPGDCPQTVPTGTTGNTSTGGNILVDHHEKGEQWIVKGGMGDPQTTDIRKRMREHKWWLVGSDKQNGVFFPGEERGGSRKKTILAGLMEMAEQMTSVGYEQMRIIGTFFDAKHLLEHNRTVQELQVQANKDYHPSESFCAFGTNVRSLADSELRGHFNRLALGKINMARQLSNDNNSNAEPGNDIRTRWERFRTTYCDIYDNGWERNGGGLESACGTGATDRKRINRDIDYTRLIENPRTLEIDFHNTTASADEQDVIALSRNLYGHRTPLQAIADLNKARSRAQPEYMKLRGIVAKRAVAQDSFNTIVGLKSESQEAGYTKPFMAAIVRDTGIEPEEIFEYLGKKPSYFTQLEVLSKKMFQNPNFFVGLVDKPANVKRQKAAMNAVELMLDRAIFESELRQEMIMSVLLSSRTRDEFKDVFKKLPTVSEE